MDVEQGRWQVLALVLETLPITLSYKAKRLVVPGRELGEELPVLKVKLLQDGDIISQAKNRTCSFLKGFLSHWHSQGHIDRAAPEH